MQTIYFKAPWGNSVIASTIIISVIILAASYGPLQMAGMPKIGVKILGIALLALMSGVIVVAYLLSPKGYMITDDKLVIDRPIKSIEIRLAEISNVEEAATDILKDSTRLLGCDGLWGLYGRYQNDKLGNYRLYVRQKSGQVIIRSRDTYVIAPEKPSEFKEALRRAVKTCVIGGTLK